MSGRTESVIIQTPALHGIEPSPVAVARWAAAPTAGYEAARADLAERGRVLPGTPKALAAGVLSPTRAPRRGPGTVGQR